MRIANKILLKILEKLKKNKFFKKVLNLEKTFLLFHKNRTTIKFLLLKIRDRLCTLLKI